MSYEKSIHDSLAKYYHVDYINTDEVLKKVREKYRKNSKIIRGALKSLNILRDIYIEKEMIHYENATCMHNIMENNTYDIIFAINGDGVSNNLYSYIFSRNISAVKILYLWDDKSNLFKSNHICFFNYVYSYNILDCKKYGYKFQSMFTQQKGIDILKYDNNKIYDICIIGSATEERVKLVKKLLNKYRDIYTFFIYLYSKDKRDDIETYDVPMRFEEYMRTLEKSKCMLEIVRMNQKGPTTRIKDCLFTKTKVITNNNFAKWYPNRENVLVLNDKCEIPLKFVYDEYCANDLKGVYVEEWITNIVLCNENGSANGGIVE